MIQDNKLTIIRQNCILEIIYDSSICQITAIQIHNLVNKYQYHVNQTKKISATFNCVFQSSSTILSQFNNSSQFFQFMKQPLNYRIDFQNSQIILKWKIIAHSFRKKIQYKYKMQQKQFTLKQQLKCQLMSLKKQLTQYQRAQRYRIRKNNNRRKTFKPTNQNISTHSNGAYQQPIIIQSTNKKNRYSLKSQKNQQKFLQIDSKSDDHEKQQIKCKKKRIKKCPQHKQKPTPKLIQNPKHSQKQLPKNPKHIQQKLYSDNYGQQDSQYQKSYQRLSINDFTQKDQLQKQSQQKLLNSSSSDHLLIQQSHYVSSVHQPCHQFFQDNKCRQSEISDKQKEGEQQTEEKKKIRCDFTNGDYYFGHIKNGQYHGEGIQYIHADGTNYEGKFKNGKRQGKGKKWDKEGNVLQGNFKEGKVHGKGVSSWTNGQKYQGNFQMGLKSGYGTYYYKNGYYYEGQWKNDKCDGFGKEVYTDGSWFQGIWIEDKIHGKGILHSQFGDVIQIYSYGKLVLTTPVQNKLQMQQ